ncbi:MAG: DUF5716 family protein [Eubacteriales bacterium]|nr:DUF5716 family protein [Eubacteriales bacterium]
MDYYMQLLVALYQANSREYAFSQLTDGACRSIFAETIARVNLVWWEDETEREGTEEENATGLTPSAALDRLVKWGWLSSDFDEKLNCYIISFPEYSRLYVELFARLEQEDDSRERESILAIYSALYTYQKDEEKNNGILKSAVQSSRSLGQMLSNMQDSMRAWFDELSSRKDFIGIQEVLVRELNNSESEKYAILTTRDSFYRYKEAVRELISDILNDSEKQRASLEKRLQEAMRADEGLREAGRQRLERAMARCAEAVTLVYQVEREFDRIEKKYNRLIELKTVFARRALARIHYLLQEGADREDRTLALIHLLAYGEKKEEVLEGLRDSLRLSAPFTAVSADSLYSRRIRRENDFAPVAAPEAEQTQIGDFVPRPLYTGRELEEFRQKNTRDGAFAVSEETVGSLEDLEKLLLVWQEAAQDRQSQDLIRLGEEIRQPGGFTYTGFVIEGKE